MLAPEFAINDTYWRERTCTKCQGSLPLIEAFPFGDLTKFLFRIYNKSPPLLQLSMLAVRGDKLKCELSQLNLLKSGETSPEL